jgi:hypothetical protein
VTDYYQSEFDRGDPDGIVRAFADAIIQEMKQDDFITDTLPVPGDRISCGNRKGLPKKQRRHKWISLGVDTKNKGAEGICEVDVSACIVCGKDKR